MAQRRSPVHWYVDLRSGEAIPYVVQAGQRVWVTHAKLVDPASVPAGQTAVRVALRTRTGDSESLVLSAERPSARVRSTEVLEDDFWLERDEDGSDDAVVRFRGRCVNLLAPETVEGVDGEEESDVEDDDDGGIEEGEDMVDGDGISDDEEEGHDVVDQQAVLEEEEEYYDAEAAGLEDYVEMMEDHELTDLEESDDDDDHIADHDWEEEESDGEFEVRGEDEFDVSVAEQVLGGSARRFAATGSTAGYMRMQVVTAAEAGSHGNDDRQILVHYRYTRFSATSFDGGVEACGSTMEHQLRFIADGSHGARSLAWAGASLVPLIYPAHYSSNRLGKLWSRLIAGVGIPPHATRVEVFVEVGILRPEDRTPARITHMCDILKDMMAEPWPEGFTGMELHLPEPVRCGHDEDDDGDTKGEEQPGKRRRAVAAGEPDDDNDTDGEERPTKRRRVVSAGETCTVCLELLEGDDLAAWPGCGKPHVFHGRCLELVLEKSDRCPICRRGL